jgi:hypothetical protein
MLEIYNKWGEENETEKSLSYHYRHAYAYERPL